MISNRSMRVVISVLATLVVGFGAYRVYLSTTFQLTGTTPALSEVGTISPAITLRFNRLIADGSASIVSTPGIITSSKVEGKNVVLILSTPMKLSQKYTIIIKTISDTQGKIILNKHIEFTPKDLSTQQIIKNQGAVATPQPPSPRTRSNVAYINFDELTAQGATSGELTQIETYLFMFKPSAKKITLTPNTVSLSNDPTTGDFVVTFNVMIDSNPYHISLSYLDVNNIHLLIFNPSGTQVFDSASHPS